MTLKKERIVDDLLIETGLKRLEVQERPDLCWRSSSGRLSLGRRSGQWFWQILCEIEESSQRVEIKTVEDLILRPGKVSTFQCPTVLKDKINNKV